MTDTSPLPAEPGAPPDGAPVRRRPNRVAAIVLAAAVMIALLVLGGLALYVRGGGPAPAWTAFLRPGASQVLEPSAPAEVVLRTLRLAGIQRAAVGDASGTVVVRVELPEVRTPADVALTWQSSMASAAAAYPAAKTVVVQLFSGSQSLVEVSASAADIAAAVKADDAAALRGVCRFSYISESGGD